MAESFFIQTCKKVSDLISALSGLNKTTILQAYFAKLVRIGFYSSLQTERANSVPFCSLCLFPSFKGNIFSSKLECYESIYCT